MRTNKTFFYISFAVAILTISFGIVLICYKGCTALFWQNVMLAIFGSSFMLAISSFAGYFVEKRRFITRYSSFARSMLLQTARFLNENQITEKSASEIYHEACMLHSFYDSFAYENNYDIQSYFALDSTSKKKAVDLEAALHKVSKEISTICHDSQKSMLNKTEYKLNTTITKDVLNKIISQARSLS